MNLSYTSKALKKIQFNAECYAFHKNPFSNPIPEQYTIVRATTVSLALSPALAYKTTQLFEFQLYNVEFKA